MTYLYYSKCPDAQHINIYIFWGTDALTFHDFLTQSSTTTACPTILFKYTADCGFNSTLLVYFLPFGTTSTPLQLMYGQIYILFFKRYVLAGLNYNIRRWLSSEIHIRRGRVLQSKVAVTTLKH